MKTICALCKKEINRIPCRIKERNYCSNSHQIQYEFEHGIRDKFKITHKANEACRRKGLEKFRNNPTFKIGKRGYKLIYIPKIGWKKYHHYKWEKHYGKIQKGEIIHHIDGNPLNNKLSNLIKLSSQSDHLKLHWRLKKSITN